MGRWGLYSAETDIVLDCFGTIMEKLQEELHHKKQLCYYIPFPQYYDKFFEILRKYIGREYDIGYIMDDTYLLSGILYYFSKNQSGLRGSGMAEKWDNEESPYTDNKMPTLIAAIPKDIKILAAKWLNNYYVKYFDNDSESISTEWDSEEDIEVFEKAKEFYSKNKMNNIKYPRDDDDCSYVSDSESEADDGPPRCLNVVIGNSLDDDLLCAIQDEYARLMD